MQPSITDWIQAFGILLGVPFTIYSLYKLFRKSKEKDEKLNALEDIAVSQNVLIGKMNQQIVELQNQTEALRIHNEIVNEGNSILRELVHLKSEAVLDEKSYKEEVLKLHEKDRKNRIKPYFILDGAGGNSQSFNFYLKNIGEDAFMVAFQNSDLKEVIITPEYNEGQLIKKNQRVKIKISPNVRDKKIGDVQSQQEISFFNSEEDEYVQKISITNGKMKIEKPIEKSES